MPSSLSAQRETFYPSSASRSDSSQQGAHAPSRWWTRHDTPHGWLALRHGRRGSAERVLGEVATGTCAARRGLNQICAT